MKLEMMEIYFFLEIERSPENIFLEIFLEKWLLWWKFFVFQCIRMKIIEKNGDRKLFFLSLIDGKVKCDARVLLFYGNGEICSFSLSSMLLAFEIHPHSKYQWMMNCHPKKRHEGNASRRCLKWYLFYSWMENLEKICFPFLFFIPQSFFFFVLFCL